MGRAIGDRGRDRSIGDGGGRGGAGGFRSGFGSFERAVAKVLLASALLPTGPLLGLGLPVELGIATLRDGEQRRVSALELATDRVQPGLALVRSWLGRTLAATADAVRARPRSEEAGSEGVGGAFVATADALWAWPGSEKIASERAGGDFAGAADAPQTWPRSEKAASEGVVRAFVAAADAARAWPRSERAASEGVGRAFAAAADAARAWPRSERAASEGVGSSHAAAADGRLGSSSFAASIESAAGARPRSATISGPSPLNSKLSQRANYLGAASKASAGPAEAFAPPLAQPEQETRSATEEGRAQDPEDPYGIRERPSPRAPSAPLAKVPPPPSPPDFSLVRKGEASPPLELLAATPEVSVPVLPAWNLLSISWTPGDPAPAAVLAPIAGAVLPRLRLRRLRCLADPWKLWDPAAPGGYDLAAISPSIGFWLEGSAGTTLPEAGPEPVETAIPLCLGWNLVGFPASSPRPVAAALASIAGQYLRVFGFDPTDPEDPWEVYDPAVPAWANDLAELRPGRGYWIYATAATTLTISNATDGPTVSILAPTDLDEVTEPTAVVGTVRSPSLAGWELFFRAEGDAGLDRRSPRAPPRSRRSRSRPSTRRCSRTVSTSSGSPQPTPWGAPPSRWSTSWSTAR